MKMIEREINTTQVYYVSDDGVEFSNRTACIEHEKQIKEKQAYKIVDKLPRFFVYPPPSCYDDELELIKVNTVYELKALLTLRFNDPEDVCIVDEIDSFPIWLALSTEDGYGYCFTAQRLIDDYRRCANDIESRIEKIDAGQMNLEPDCYIP